MSLTLRSNFNTVTIAGRTVKLVEKFDNSTTVNRFVETIANCTDEAAINYILNTDYDSSDSYIRDVYNVQVGSFNKIARVTDTFGIKSEIMGRNAGAGFSATVKEKDFNESVALVKGMMKLLGLDEDYRLVARYENEAVYAIVRK